MKWDGFRTLAHVQDPETVRLVSRSGQDLTVTFPELGELASQVDPARLPVVLDGEIVALDRDGRPDFRRLQHRANLRKERDVARARARVQVDLMLFDVLQADGDDVTRRPYTERRELLESLVTPHAPVHLPPAFDGDLDAAMRTSRTLRLEGVVAKRRTSTYAGRRSREWLKVKHSAMQEVVIVGWRPGPGEHLGDGLAAHGGPGRRGRRRRPALRRTRRDGLHRARAPGDHRPAAGHGAQDAGRVRRAGGGRVGRPLGDAQAGGRGDVRRLGRGQRRRLGRAADAALGVARAGARTSRPATSMVELPGQA